jgi:transposase-like protein
LTGSKDTNRSWLTTVEAARRADVTPECVGKWVRQYGIGWKVAGRLRIDAEALSRLLAGEPIGRAP